jgi:hypothetical protein
MIDWQRKLYQVLHNPIPVGRILSIDHDGTMEWQSPKSIQVRGSYESSVKIRSQGGDGQGKAGSVMLLRRVAQSEACTVAKPHARI